MALCSVRNSARPWLGAPPVHFLKAAQCGFCLRAAYHTLFSGKVTEGCAPDGGHTQIMGTDTVAQQKGKVLPTHNAFAFLVRAHSNGTICQKIVNKYVSTNFELKAAN